MGKKESLFPLFLSSLYQLHGEGMLHNPHPRSYNLFRVFTSNVAWHQGLCINKSLITFVAASAQYIYNSYPAPNRHYAVVIILFAGYGLIKLPLTISLTRIHYDEA